jgi:protein-L-isoaspartate(D-aspartate) O-methyltransferase
LLTLKSNLAPLAFGYKWDEQVEERYTEMTDFAAARHNMVESQVRTNKVTSVTLIQAMERVAREMFVPADMRSVAYVDEDLPINKERFLMEPMVLARLVQIADIQPEDIVLDVGCGTGYSTAILAEISQTVIGLEVDEALAENAGTTLTNLGVDNALVVQGVLEAGYPKQAPYNVIILNGAMDELPAALTDQLADGGRLVAVLRNSDGMGVATRFLKTGNTVSAQPIFDASIPILKGFEAKTAFNF